MHCRSSNPSAAKMPPFPKRFSIQNQQIAEMKPKASYYDVVLNCKDAVAVTTIAKDYGKSGRWLNEYLHQLGIQFKQGSICCCRSTLKTAILHQDPQLSRSRTVPYLPKFTPTGPKRPPVHLRAAEISWISAAD